MYTRDMVENFDPNTIEDEGLRQVFITLMNVVENQHSKLQEQAEEIQRLRDEVNRLKGEQGKPKIKAGSVKTQKRTWHGDRWWGMLVGSNHRNEEGL